MVDQTDRWQITSIHLRGWRDLSTSCTFDASKQWKWIGSSTERKSTSTDFPLESDKIDRVCDHSWVWSDLSDDVYTGDNGREWTNDWERSPRWNSLWQFLQIERAKDYQTIIPHSNATGKVFSENKVLWYIIRHPSQKWKDYNSNDVCIYNTRHHLALFILSPTSFLPFFHFVREQSECNDENDKNEWFSTHSSVSTVIALIKKSMIPWICFFDILQVNLKGKRRK